MSFFWYDDKIIHTFLEFFVYLQSKNQKYTNVYCLFKSMHTSMSIAYQIMSRNYLWERNNDQEAVKIFIWGWGILRDRVLVYHV